jgi:hypothetical protein
MLHHAYASRIAYFDKHFPGWGGPVSRALTALELAVRAAVLGVAARVTRSRLLDVRARASAACRAELAAARAGSGRGPR